MSDLYFSPCERVEFNKSSNLIGSVKHGRNQICKHENIEHSTNSQNVALCYNMPFFTVNGFYLSYRKQIGTPKKRLKCVHCLFEAMARQSEVPVSVAINDESLASKTSTIQIATVTTSKE